MITKQGFESLYGNTGISNTFFQKNKEVDLKELSKQSISLCEKWENYYCDNSSDINFKLTDDMKFVYKTTEGTVRTSDITEFAFSQLCTRLGVPAGYINKCFDFGKGDLAITNFRAWANDCDKKLLVREQNGVVRAVLSDTYVPFDSHRIIRTLQNSVDTGKYKANDVYLSEDRMNLRFVNREPMDVTGEKSPIYSGFTVSSSDVGRGGLTVNYYIFRLVCNNGMTVTEKGGNLFRQTHIGSKMSDGKVEAFNRLYKDIDIIDNLALDSIRYNQEVFLKDYEMQMYLEKAKRELKLSEKGYEKLVSIIDLNYGHTRWGVLNGVTELAQEYTLDKRIEFETFAGNTMINVA